MQKRKKENTKIAQKFIVKNRKFSKFRDKELRRYLRNRRLTIRKK